MENTPRGNFRVSRNEGAEGKVSTNDAVEIRAETLVTRSLCKASHFVPTIRCLTTVNALRRGYYYSKKLYSRLHVIVGSRDLLARGGISFKWNYRKPVDRSRQRLCHVHPGISYFELHCAESFAVICHGKYRIINFRKFFRTKPS